MPGSVILESIDEKKMVTGDPAKLVKLPILKKNMKDDSYKDLAKKILTEYCDWSNEYNKTEWKFENDVLNFNSSKSIKINSESHIVILTEPGQVRNGLYFNLPDLTTDSGRDPLKLKLEEFLRLHYGLIFLQPS
jgi:hypothetical protein